MDFRKVNAAPNTISRDINKMCEPVGNVYEMVKIIAKRSNQINAEIKSELDKKLHEFSSLNENIEEVFENREQIEISRYYEKLPKPVLIATQEFIENKIYYRNPVKESKLK
jgi:DNA-directed RNA polymerase subunit K/omega